MEIETYIDYNGYYHIFLWENDQVINRYRFEEQEEAEEFISQLKQKQLSVIEINSLNELP